MSKLSSLMLIISLCFMMTYNYKLSSVLINFNDAISHCHEVYNSSMITIFTLQQNAIISQLCWNKSNIITNCWIGLHKRINEDNWYWIENNATTNFSKWSGISQNGECVEIIANPQQITDKDAYKGNWNKISCDMLRHPICNDPPSSNDLITSRSILNQYHQTPQSHYNRRLLQAQNISCNWTESDHDLCVIYASNVSARDIECNSNYPNCQIFLEYYENATIYCPSNNCLSCIINCSYQCVALEIKGNECQLTSVLGAYWLKARIHAPSNNGTLEVKATMTHSEIYSSLGTADIIITIDGFNYFSGNIVYGQNITGSLNFSCIESAGCYFNKIECSPGNIECNINCSSAFWFGYAGCEGLIVNVDLSQRISDINWYCDESVSRVCVDAKLECGDPDNRKYSLWKYDDFNDWYYVTGDCVKNWTPPTVTCSVKTDNACYIVRPILKSSRTIQCVDDLTQCLVQLGDDLQIEEWSTDLQSYLHCPSLECESCTIQCISEFACSGITIYGYNCSTVEVIIRTSWQSALSIYAPGNGGELIISTPSMEERRTFFTANKIYSSPGTRNIIININDWGTHNFIDGKHVVNYLNITCGTYADCKQTQIICPNDANCNIRCKGNCPGMQVVAIEGTHDVNWRCDTKSWCQGAVLFCNHFSQMSTWIRSGNGEWQLENNTNGCVDIPTIAPSPAPTVPSTSPTIAPSISPSATPSISPTLPPTISSKAPTSPPTAAPTQSPTSAPVIPEVLGLDKTEFGLITGGSLLLFVLIVGGLIYYYKYYKIEKKSLYITKGLVILIGIGEYDQGSTSTEIDGYLTDLQGIDKDIEHMLSLFYDELNYDVYPSEYLDSIKNGYDPKQHWTETELKEFLEDRAKYLEEHIKEYDGLIVIISSHGIDRCIVTSDYKKFSKSSIHRIFSISHPKCRHIPRLFLFDCCSGEYEQEIKDSSSDEDNEDDLDEDESEEKKLELNSRKTIRKMAKISDIGKNVSSKDIDKSVDQIWIKGDDNPDYQLAVIEAANYGFQSKLRSDIGSYVINSFYEKTMHILKENKRKFIYQTFESIQMELHEKGKQLPTFTWNTDSRYIRFKKANNTLKRNLSTTQIELTYNEIDESI